MEEVGEQVQDPKPELVKLSEHPILEKTAPYFIFTAYDRDGGHSSPRIRVDFRSRGTPREIIEEVLKVETLCCRCRLPIFPFRKRAEKEGAAGRAVWATGGIYVAVSCPRKRNPGCCNGADAELEGLAIREAVCKVLGVDPEAYTTKKRSTGRTRSRKTTHDESELTESLPFKMVPQGQPEASKTCEQPDNPPACSTCGEPRGSQSVRAKTCSNAFHLVSGSEAEAQPDPAQPVAAPGPAEDRTTILQGPPGCRVDVRAGSLPVHPCRGPLSMWEVMIMKAAEEEQRKDAETQDQKSTDAKEASCTPGRCVSDHIHAPPEPKTCETCGHTDCTDQANRPDTCKHWKGKPLPSASGPDPTQPSASQWGGKCGGCEVARCANECLRAQLDECHPPNYKHFRPQAAGETAAKQECPDCVRWDPSVKRCVFSLDLAIGPPPACKLFRKRSAVDDESAAWAAWSKNTPRVVASPPRAPAPQRKPDGAKCSRCAHYPESGWCKFKNEHRMPGFEACEDFLCPHCGYRPPFQPAPAPAPPPVYPPRGRRCGYFYRIQGNPSLTPMRCCLDIRHFGHHQYRDPDGSLLMEWPDSDPNCGSLPWGEHEAVQDFLREYRKLTEPPLLPLVGSTWRVRPNAPLSPEAVRTCRVVQATGPTVKSMRFPAQVVIAYPGSFGGEYSHTMSLEQFLEVFELENKP